MSAVSTVAKPLMRGMHVAQIKKILIGATLVGSYDFWCLDSIFRLQFSTATSAAWYLGVNKPRKEAYKNFYATYDADADFERMKVNVLLNL